MTPRALPVIALALFLLTLARSASAQASPPVPPGEQRAFALGLALQAPAVRAEVFLEAVRGLPGAADEEDSNAAVGRLAQQASGLRLAEARAYGETSRLLRAMGAPPSVRGWADGTARLLSAPPVMSKDAHAYLKTDPDTATVLSAIDEAEAVKLIADRNAPALGAWLKLSSGGAGVWAATLGRLVAGMRIASATSKPFLLPRETVRHLRLTAPPGTPLEVLRVLSALAPRGHGNLGYLVPLTPITVPPETIAVPAQAFIDAFNAQVLADALTGPT